MKNREEEIRAQENKQFSNDRAPANLAKIPVIEEKVSIGKEVKETGKVRLTKKVHEEEQLVDIPGIQEEVDVERIAINKYVDSPPPPVRHEGDTTVISVLREVTVVEKRLELVEEVRITKRQVKTENAQTVTLRREEVNVEHSENNEPGSGKTL